MSEQGKSGVVRGSRGLNGWGACEALLGVIGVGLTGALLMFPVGRVDEKVPKQVCVTRQVIVVEHEQDLPLSMPVSDGYGVRPSIPRWVF
ncbi:hypothetical protein [Zestomonas carbonaria]|uniref:Uncharacterized protein n=1 Tax=Zestomonas carbonaria TaxID=2762745 RepID=A0A7U7EJK7_9GAMM|nr:hypothetical protein [Pseudomonas carbonaria]CAD5106218.1 hypothetical protein PSEWESI4_00478 [Pseudomonas carbonaria]